MATATSERETVNGQIGNGGRVHEGELLDGLPSRQTFVESQTHAAIDVQIATAKRFPRSIKKFHADALSLATLDEETAGSCFYSVPRDGKQIEGPSVRLAEIVAACWGNLRAQANIVDEDDQFITASGMAWDLEKNVAVSTEVRRRITNKYGKRYSADMINTTANAACSIALRNAMFKVIPLAMIRPVYDAARKVAIGDATTLVKRRSDMVTAFQKMGVSAEQICTAVNKVGLEDIGLDELATLRGLYTAIKDGETSVDDAFPRPETTKPTTEKPATKTEQLTEKLKAEQAAPGGATDTGPSPEISPHEELARRLRAEFACCKDTTQCMAVKQQYADSGEMSEDDLRTLGIEFQSRVDSFKPVVTEPKPVGKKKDTLV